MLFFFFLQDDCDTAAAAKRQIHVDKLQGVRGVQRKQLFGVRTSLAALRDVQPCVCRRNRPSFYYFC